MRAESSKQRCPALCLSCFMMTQTSVSTEACGDTQLLSVQKLPSGTSEARAHY